MPPFPFVSPSFKKRNVKIKDSNIIYFPSDTIKEFKISKILSSCFQIETILINGSGKAKFQNRYVSKNSYMEHLSFLRSKVSEEVFFIFYATRPEPISKVSRSDLISNVWHTGIGLFHFRKTLFDSKAICAWNWERERTDARPSGQTMKRITCAPARRPTL